MSSKSEQALARVFWTGRSQAVRLPKLFRVDATQLRIYHEGRRIILEVPEETLDEYGWPEGFWSEFGVQIAEFDLGSRSERAERSDLLSGE